MGICFLSYTVSDGNLSEILADPALVWRVVEPDDDTAYLHEAGIGRPQSLLSKLFGKPRPVPPVRTLAFSEHELRVLDLDKSWDGLRACLKACAPQAPDFFEGEGPVGTVDIGYGPGLYIRSDHLARIAGSLLAVSEAQLLDALRTTDFTGTYLGDLWARSDDDCRDYLLHNFRDLQAFLRHAAGHSLGAVLRFT
jgi:hypothetical protein